MTIQKTRPRTQHSGLRPQAALKLFSTASPGGPFWTQDTSSAASQRRRKYAELLPHILQQRSGPASQRLADFLRHLAPSSGDCAVNSDSIRATLISVEVPGTS